MALAAIGLGVVIGAIVLPPAYALVKTSLTQFIGLGTGPLTLANYREIFQSDGVGRLFANTFVFALASAIVSVALGAFLAWLVERTDAPFKRFTYLMVFLSFAVPGLIQVMGWSLLLGPNAGALNNFIRWASGGFFDGFDVNSMTGMIFVQGILWIPIMFFLMIVPIRAMNPGLEEAALVSGANGWQVFWRITVRLARPGLIAAFVLSFVRSIEAFDVPIVIGLPASVHTLTTRVYLEAQGSFVPKYGTSAAYGMMLLVIVGLLLVYYGRQTAEAKNFVTVSGRGVTRRPIHLHRWRWPAGAFVLLVGIVLLLPKLVILWASLLPSYESPSWSQLSTVSLANFSAVAGESGLMKSVTNTILIAVVTASVASLLGFGAAWIIVRSRVRGARALDYLISFGLVFPGVVAAVAVLRTYVRTPMYDTIWLIAICFVLCFMPYALRYNHVGLLQIDRELEESALVTGAGYLSVIRRVVLPLVLPAFFGAWIFIFLVASREFAMALILHGAQSETVSVKIYGLWASAGISHMAALSVLVAAGAVLVAYLSFAVSRRYGVNQQL